MALTRGAGVLMQILALPFIAIGFPVMLFPLMGAAATGEYGPALPTILGGLLATGIGFWMLRAGKRASRPPAA